MWPHPIPHDAHFQSLVFCHASQAIVAQFAHKMPDGNWKQMLFYRPDNSNDYTLIKPDDEPLCFQNAVVCVSESLVIFSSWRPEHGGYNWESIRALETKTGKVSVLLSGNSLSVTPPVKRIWPSTLISALPNGEGVIASVAFETETDKNCSTVYYWLCEIRFGSQLSIKKLKELKNVFI